MILCADDYGMNTAVSEGILNLIQNKKVNSVSCITTTDNWKEKAKDLLPYSKNIEIGLHLTLTDPKPIYFSKSSLKALIKKIYLKQVHKKELLREFHAQIDLFKKHLGRLPDYIDGHEFCHHFPITRDSLVDLTNELDFKKNKIYIRIFNPSQISFLKNPIFYLINKLACFPSKKLIQLLKNNNLNYNSRLLGLHPYFLNPKKYFEYYFSAQPRKKDIFFTHPGLLSNDFSDPLRKYRVQLYEFMMSSEFDNLLKKYQITLNTHKVIGEAS